MRHAKPWGACGAILTVALLAAFARSPVLSQEGVAAPRPLLGKALAQGGPPAARPLGATGADQPSFGVTLGEPMQALAFRQPGSLGLFNVPDMHTAALPQTEGSYLLWITGNIGPSAGAIARLSTSDFTHYRNAGPGTPMRAEPVMVPSCRAAASGASQRRLDPRVRDAKPGSRAALACTQDPDADYVGANSVMVAADGKGLLMFYEAGNKSIGNTSISHGWEFNVVARARSSDNGLTWRREDVVVSGADSKPTERSEVTQPGISEFGTVVANGYIYMLYQYVPNSASDADAPAVIQVARAPLASDGAAGTWMKYYQGAFSQPGISGRGSPVVTTGGTSGCTRLRGASGK
jgi:hypothetical protein